MDFKEIEQARKILGLPEYATSKEINQVYRDLALKYHPDRCKEEKKLECEEKFKQISHAKNLLFAYCSNYRFSFKEKDVQRNSYDADFYNYLNKFYDDWWGEI